MSSLITLDGVAGDIFAKAGAVILFAGATVLAAEAVGLVGVAVICAKLLEPVSDSANTVKASPRENVDPISEVENGERARPGRRESRPRGSPSRAKLRHNMANLIGPWFGAGARRATAGGGCTPQFISEVWLILNIVFISVSVPGF
jgi:hypothetical protein